jgi:hypothetical protein
MPVSFLSIGFGGCCFWAFSVIFDSTIFDFIKCLSRIFKYKSPLLWSIEIHQRCFILLLNLYSTSSSSIHGIHRGAFFKILIIGFLRCWYYRYVRIK